MDVPDNAYSLMVSEVLPSLPLYTLAGYLLVEGGASTRLLRVYNALFGWLPGGLAITTAVAFAIFTFAGSGVTIVSMGGLMLPMLIKARYSERFSIGLINGSGSLGLLFPPSLPGDPLRRLRQDGADRHAVRGRLCARAADGGDGLRMGRLPRREKRAPSARSSPSRRRARPSGPPSGNWRCP